MEHFDKNNILTNSQRGYHKERSCESQSIDTLHDIATMMTKGSQFDSIILYFTKASDKVPNKRLLYKLNDYGVDIKANRWIWSF